MAESSAQGKRRRIARTRIDRVALLTPADRDAMFALMVRYYSGVTREQFEADLDEKRHLIRMFDEAGRVCGFSTLQELSLEHGGRPLLVVFSGDTVIDEDCWGQKHLQRAFTKFLFRCWLLNPRQRVFWFLITKGFKTYLLMRNNFASYPNYREATPPEVQAILDHVARLKYPEHFDPARGVITFPEEEASAVRTEFCQLSSEVLQNPEIRFFAERNPGFVRGDELCCLAKVRAQELAWISLKYGLWHPLRRLLRFPGGRGDGGAREQGGGVPDAGSSQAQPVA